jgi:hypothetical protein
VARADQGKDRDATRDDFAHDHFGRRGSQKPSRVTLAHAFVSVNTCQHLNYVKTLSLNLSFV